MIILFRQAGALMSAALIAVVCASIPAKAERFTVRTETIERFRIGSDETNFGPLKFVGGLNLIGGHRHLGAFSAFRYRDGDGGRFVAVSDTGFFFFARIKRDADGRPASIADASLSEMTDETGKAQRAKYLSDAEGLSLSGDTASVAFERVDRIVEFQLEGDSATPLSTRVPIIIPERELRRNGGLEALVRTPDDSVFKGARIAIAETSIDRNGNILAAVLEGPRRGEFSVRKSGRFSPTDAAILPDGRLLLLERSFSMARGVGMQLRMIDLDAIRPGAVVDGDVVLTTDMRYQIDNMEGIDAFRTSDGAVRVGLISDDNRSLLQRTLYLEFEIETQ
ncbi:esterase-like activity of phytase family protein [Notoacmeibacter sp. MSK16QG-6]|uniref:esterase-like activity of phytase family protein n=1 Tax=Notoacmeibacter sp. MSK16QG-6 TaxID=2957982 RepID=UPI00209FB08B|nr:esterase-like activity of phytase family protein [Notoacmeibacter sp. MSK16QG-6]MCP1199999.1 esterase-like activity of phytase family protein [Notoacmeibacter sp. MSK16QG-6]